MPISAHHEISRRDTDFRMDGQFQRKITDDLWKSGLGSELKALKAFNDRDGWAAVTGSSFFDPVLNISRELDFAAHKHRFRQRNHQFLFNVTVSLIAEVKKSEKPWVVLHSSQWTTPELPFLMNSIIRSTAAVPMSDIQAAFAKGSVITANKWFGHGVHEAFKKPNEHGRWFAAAAKTCRASIAATQRPLLEFQSDTWVVEYVQPLILLDGQLIVASLDQTDEILLQDIPYASVQFEERGSEAARAFVIDLVTVESLPSYIDQIERGFEHCFNLLAEYRS